jgi:hypothetical protein
MLPSGNEKARQPMGRTAGPAPHNWRACLIRASEALAQGFRKEV